MHPRALRPLVLLCRFVGMFPVTLGVPPESSERLCESRWRCGLTE
jgi:hypothetical protein